MKPLLVSHQPMPRNVHIRCWCRRDDGRKREASSAIPTPRTASFPMTLRTAIQILAGAAIITLETIGKPVVVPAEARLVFRPEHVIVDNVTIEPQKTMRVPQAPGSFAINAVQQRQLLLEEVKVGDARHALFFKDVFLCLWFGGGPYFTGSDNNFADHLIIDIPDFLGEFRPVMELGAHRFDNSARLPVIDKLIFDCGRSRSSVLQSLVFKLMIVKDRFDRLGEVGIDLKKNVSALQPWQRIC